MIYVAFNKIKIWYFQLRKETFLHSMNYLNAVTITMTVYLVILVKSHLWNSLTNIPYGELYSSSWPEHYPQHSSLDLITYYVQFNALLAPKTTFTSVLSDKKFFGRFLRVRKHLEVPIVDAGRKIRNTLLLLVRFWKKVIYGLQNR